MVYERMLAFDIFMTLAVFPVAKESSNVSHAERSACKDLDHN